MKTQRLGVFVALLTGGVLAGCTTDQYARMLIEQDTNLGKRLEMLLGSSADLVKNNKISLARRYTMPDKIEIDVWVMKASPKAPARGTVLVLHGLADSKPTYYNLARVLNEKGFDVVLPDLRAHGRSTGKHVTFGALEKIDCQHVIDNLYQEKLIAEPLYAFGGMMGGAIAIDYAAIDPHVQGVVAVAPYRDLYSYGRALLRLVAPLISDQDLKKVVARAGEIGGFNPSESSTVNAAAKVRCPLYLIHGGMDLIIPTTESQAIHAAAKGPKQLDIAPLLGPVGVLFGREEELSKAVEKVASGQLESATQPTTGRIAP